MTIKVNDHNLMQVVELASEFIASKRFNKQLDLVGGEFTYFPTIGEYDIKEVKEWKLTLHIQQEPTVTYTSSPNIWCVVDLTTNNIHFEGKYGIFTMTDRDSDASPILVDTQKLDIAHELAFEYMNKLDNFDDALLWLLSVIDAGDPEWIFYFSAKCKIKSQRCEIRLDVSAGNGTVKETRKYYEE